MKIRLGFVSNSSTSSFCIYGCYIKESDIKEYFNYDIEDQVNEFEYHQPPDYDGVGIFIGLHPSKCRENETMGEFKSRVVSIINKTTLKPIPEKSFNWQEEGWYDG